MRQLNAMRAEVPADTNLPDQLVFGLSAHQLLLVVPAVGSGIGLFFVGRALPAWALVGAAAAWVIFAMGSIAFAVADHDGEALDSYLAQVLRERRRPRREVHAPDGLPALPAWAGGGRPEATGAMTLPWEGVDPDGNIALGRDERGRRLGVACVLAASPLDYEAMAPAELEAVCESAEEVLKSLEAPLQVLVRAEAQDLAGPIGALRARAAELGGDGLGRIAAERAGMLEAVAGEGHMALSSYLCLRADDTAALGERAARLAESLARLDVRLRRLGCDELEALLRRGAPRSEPGSSLGAGRDHERRSA
jgi:hypothetical protein